MSNHDSIKNRAIKLYRLLHHRKYREKYKLIVLEGFHLLNEATRAGVKVKTVFYTSRFSRDPVNRALLEQQSKANLIALDSNAFKAIAQTDNPQGVGAIAEAPWNNQGFLLDQNRKFFVVLDAIQDPGNVGTIIRTAAAAAVDGVVLLPGTVDPFNPKALRASMGGIFYLSLALLKHYGEWMDICSNRDIQVVAADPEGSCLFHEVDFRLPSAVIIGNESKGISNELLETVDVAARIPISGEIASLNAAVAASILIFERIRQSC